MPSNLCKVFEADISMTETIFASITPHMHLFRAPHAPSLVQCPGAYDICAYDAAWSAVNTTSTQRAPVYHLYGLGGSTTLGASVFDMESRSSHLEPIALSLVPAKTAVLQDEQTGDVDVSGPVRHPLTGMQDHTRRRAEADFAAHDYQWTESVKD
ncbi:hypothetical protein B0H13DRAFT_2305547 [Mycena leptocephala]|nr:hypothetical protein B0H13DRAFT_2305547 [Mycena leptocephala]